MAKKAYIGVEGVARKVKKGYIGIEKFAKRNLPSSYTQVEYIESTGTQYVDTGFVPNNDSRIVLDVQLTSTATQHIFGARATSTSGLFFAAATSATVIRVDYGSEQKSNTVASVLDRVTIDLNKNTCLVGSASTTYTAATFTPNATMLLFGSNTAGTIVSDTYKARMKLYSCQIYDNGTLIRDYVPCTNASGAAGLYDLVNGTFSADAAGGSFVAGGAVKSLARKIKKAYIGIGGVARPCWSGGELAYYGTITALSKGRYHLAAASNSNYAIFAGGYGGGFGVTTVDAYNKSYTRSSPTAIDKRWGIQGASVGDYALFGGGHNNGTSYNTTYAYNSALTRTKPTAFRDTRYALASTTVGNYALFGGGNTRTVDAYNASLTREAPTDLSYYMQDHAAATAGDYALFPNPSGGGVDAYNKSLTKTTTNALSQNRYGFAATSVGGFAIFAGGSNGSNYSAHNYNTYYSTADAYDSSLTKRDIAAMNTSRFHHAAATIGGFALFAGGGWSVKATVTCYNAELTRLTPPTALSEARYKLAATTLGECALFAGGTNGSGSDYTIVDAYIIA